MITDKQTPDKPKKRAQKPRKQPEKDIFTLICKTDLKIEVVKEFIFHPTRKWRFDFAIPSLFPNCFEKAKAGGHFLFFGLIVMTLIKCTNVALAHNTTIIAIALNRCYKQLFIDYQTF